MNRDHAIDVAVSALHYVLDNDTDYLTEECIALYEQALRTLQPQQQLTEANLYLVMSDDDDGPAAA